MKIDRDAFRANLFYSYSHKDEQYRNNMETALAQLRREHLLSDWSDQKILPGQSISKEIKEKMDEVDIFVFLLSSDFIKSEACIEEWKYAKQLAAEGKSIFRIPIILRDCAWKDFLNNDDIKVLPNDGKPIVGFENKDTAWLQVYEGIKVVINRLKKTFIPEPEFLKEMEKTDFIAQQHIKLRDIFIFPTLSCSSPQVQDELLQEEIIEDQTKLLEKKYILIHGADRSGKTALGRHLYISLLNAQSTPVLHIDLKEVPRKVNHKVFSRAYYGQFSGDYSLWKQQKDKILILDNLSSDPNLIEFIELAKQLFDKIVVTLSSDIFYSYFRDDERLADFHEVKIEPLNHKKQEELIRKRLELSDRSEPISDGLVDKIEDRVNSIIISNKIVPRYPFFVLSILQAYKAFSEENFSIISYGHCYHGLIISNLLKAGISGADNDIDPIFNFAENLAFKNYESTQSPSSTKFNLDEFVKEYRMKFILSDSILNRLKNDDYGIITDKGSFKSPYMYYFFLGKFLSEKNEENQGIIRQMCEQSHVSLNYLTLLFIIHHTNDNEIINDILLRTKQILKDTPPAKLDRTEIENFRGIVDDLSENMLTDSNVETERRKEREFRDITRVLTEMVERLEEQIDEDEDTLNDTYQILKNNEIIGQILRNKYGSLERPIIKEAIETIADSGLRLVTLLLDEDLITNSADYVSKMYPDYDIDKIKGSTRYILFLWTIGNIMKIVNSINVPRIREIVDEVVQQKSTPAYDLIGYFNLLDSVETLTDSVKQALQTLLKKHNNFFFRGVLSMRTQHYMKTHRSSVPIEQSVSAMLYPQKRYSYKPVRSTTRRSDEN